jgi:hypothetical protein
MNGVSTKISVGSASAAGSVGVPVVVIWLLGLFKVPVPPDVAAVLSGWLAAGASLLFGYLVREMKVPDPAALPPQPAAAAPQAPPPLPGV